ncbi:MAG TPA: Maf family protein [Rhizomicrobium sp.]
MSLILASASISRARMLRDAGVPFEIRPAHVDEDAVKESLLAEKAKPGEIAGALAELKALRISANAPGALVLGADQVLDFEGELISKMPDRASAKALLQRLSGKKHELISAAVLARNGAAIWRHTGRVRLRMRAVSETFLDDYLAREGEELFRGVGCYRLEGLGAQLFERVDGDYFSVLGLPLLPLLAQLRELDALPK